MPVMLGLSPDPVLCMPATTPLLKLPLTIGGSQILVTHQHNLGSGSPNLPTGTGVPGSPGFSPTPWQAAQVAEPLSSNTEPADLSSSWLCPLNTDQQEGSQQRGDGPGILVTKDNKEPAPD